MCNSDANNFGFNLQELMIKNKIKEKDLANYIGVNDQTVSNWVTINYRKAPNWSVYMYKLLLYLYLNLDTFHPLDLYKSAGINSFDDKKTLKETIQTLQQQIQEQEKRITELEQSNSKNQNIVLGLKQISARYNFDILKILKDKHTMDEIIVNYRHKFE